MIEVTELRKRYGATQSLDGMTFRVLPGQVTGFVGPNGAGKSTTMRIILGLDAADAGTALIGGRPYRTLRHPLSHVGALLDAAALQPSRSARNHLLWLAYSQGLTARRVDEVIDQAGLRSAIRRKAGGYSLGMRQRLGIAAALLGDPPVLMLDEPFNGMDPEGIIWLRGFLRALAAEGRAVLVSSHLMSELQDTADHLIVAGRGRVIADTSMRDLLAAASGDLVRLRTSAPAEAIKTLAEAGATVAAAAPDVLLISHLSSERTVAALTASRIPFSEVSAHRATLEDAYLQLTKDAVEFSAARAATPTAAALVSWRPTSGRRRDDRHPVPLPDPARARLVRADGAGGVAQVPDGPRLGHRHGRRGAGDPGPRARSQRAGLLRHQRPGLGLHPAARPGRRGGDRQLLLRAPAAGRQRHHHRPGDVADRPDPRFLGRRGRQRRAADAQRPGALG